VNASRAARWFSTSMSIVVSTPSSGIPRSRCTPETPVPVPISTTARAPIAAASTSRVAPLPGCTGVQPSSVARARALARTSSSGTKFSA
jgi:hypothetical protein